MRAPSVAVAPPIAPVTGGDDEVVAQVLLIDGRGGPPPTPEPEPPSPPRPPPATVRFVLPADVLFEFGRARLTDDADRRLARLGRRIRRIRRLGEVREIVIDGHTDAKGAAPFNFVLSRRRALKVEREVRRGLRSAVPLRHRAFGESRPVAPNIRPGGRDNPRGRARNRRVEVAVYLSSRASRRPSPERLRQLDLRGADLAGAGLAGADLTAADLEGACLRSADLRGARLSGARLAGADVRAADLRGADLSGARFARTVYDDATLWPRSRAPAGALRAGPATRTSCR